MRTHFLWKPREKYTGETTVKAWIDNTNFEAQCKVKVINPITITWNKGEIKTAISIQNKCEAFFIDTDYQIVEMKVISLEDNSESDWIRLGIDRFGYALNKTYTYDVDNNKDYKIKVRWIRKSPYIKEEYAEMGVENEAIIYGKEHDEKTPTDTVNETYNFFVNKDKIEINVGSSDEVEIIAKRKDNITTVAEVAKDNWNVEWKIEDETIIKCIQENGIENNKQGDTQVVGRATIQGLKSGTTQVIATVKVSDNQEKEFKIPIIVKDVEKKDEDKKDDTVANKKLSKTGERSIAIFVGIVSVMMLVYFRIRMRK